MSQMSPQIQMLLQAMQTQPANNPQLSQDPSAEARANGQSGTRSGNGRGSVLGGSIRDSMPAADSSSDPFHFSQPGLLQSMNGQQKASQYDRPMGGETPVQSSLTADQRLDSYEQALPADKAAELALKRQEFELKRAQQEHESQLKERESNSKLYPIGGEGSANGDAAARGVTEDKGNQTRQTDKAKTDDKAASSQALLKMIGGSDTSAPATPAAPAATASAEPMTLMSKLLAHRTAVPYAPGMQFQHGQKVRFGDKVHQVIGADQQGNPLFSQDLLNA